MEYWVWLTGIKGVGTELQKRLLKHFHSPKAVYQVPHDSMYVVSSPAQKDLRSYRVFDFPP